MGDLSSAGEQTALQEICEEVPGWRDRFGIVAGITTRHAGSFELGAAPGGPTLDRWRALQRSLAFPSMVTSRQVHGADVASHRDVSGWLLADGYDGHVTRNPGVLLTLTVADCVPIYALDPIERAAGLFHAGWRGTTQGVLRAGLEKLVELTGSSMRNVVIHFGVGICGRCYEVGPEVLAACGCPGPAGQPGRMDLQRVLFDQARGLGVTEISRSPFCTAHDSQIYFSHRASEGRDGRMAAYLGLPT